MRRLLHRHYERVLENIQRLYAESSLPTLRHRMVVDLGRLVPGDYVSYNAVLRGPEARVVARYAYPDPPLAQTLQPAFNAHCSDHPFLGKVSGRHDSGARKFSDFMSPSQLRATGLYSEYYRKLGTRYQMYFPFDRGGVEGLGICINRGKLDFTETDRAILNLLIPHYQQAHYNVTALEKYRSALGALEETQDAIGEGGVIATPDGRMEWVSASAGSLFRTLLNLDLVAGQWLPEPLRHWSAAEQAGIAKTTAPLRLASSQGLLAVWVVVRTDNRVTILIRKSQAPGTSARIAGLTQRENEVMAWIAQAKSNGEIAGILGLSVFTVGKHVENILSKLKVESRTAAMRIFLDHERHA